MFPMWAAGNGYTTTRYTNVPVCLGHECPPMSALGHPFQLCNPNWPSLKCCHLEETGQFTSENSPEPLYWVPLTGWKCHSRLPKLSWPDYTRESAPPGRLEAWPLSLKPGKPSESASLVRPPHLLIPLTRMVSPCTFEPTYVPPLPDPSAPPSRCKLACPPTIS